MNLFSVLLLFVIIQVYLLEKSFGKIIFNNRINTNINWIYLTKFYFHPINGYIDIQLIDNDIKFFILNKQEWKNDLMMICMKNELILNQENNNNNQTNIWSLSTSFTNINQIYLILIKCNSSMNIFNVTYKVILTNGKNLFTKHFSNDEQGILILFIVSTSIYTIFFLIIIYLLKTKIYLIIIKLYLISIWFSWLNSLISLIFTFVYSLTGNDQTILYRLLRFFSPCFYFISQILFLLMLIFCVKGYLIIRIQLKTKIILKIKLFILFYILIQIIILILITISINQMIPNENLLLICDYIQMIMYILSFFWFILSLLSTKEKSNKQLRLFWIFSIWFLTNSIIILLNIFDILPNPKVTILRTIQISVQYLSYCFFQFIIRNKTFFLRTKLNQINIIYIDQTISKSSTIEREIKLKPNELINLCFIENTWASRFRMPINSFESRPRLEPRRDVLSNTLTKSTVNRSQPSNCRLPPLNHDIQ